MIHGKPKNFVPNRLKRKGVPPLTEKPGVPSAVNLTKAQVEHLCSLLSNSTITSMPASSTSHSATSNPVANISLMVRQGISEHSVASMLNSSEQWIVDSGATDHMTGNSHFFLFYSPSSGQQKVQMADGTFSTVARKWTICLSPVILLKDVLHVLKLTYNLISVCKLSTNLPCGINF